MKPFDQPLDQEEPRIGMLIMPCSHTGAMGKLQLSSYMHVKLKTGDKAGNRCGRVRTRNFAVPKQGESIILDHRNFP